MRSADSGAVFVGDVISLLGTMIAMVVLTERLKKVRVYAYARHFNFLHVRKDA